MPTDPRVAAIDSALYRLDPPTTPYSTPFTYNNGLTVLEILERIRQAVVDTITYAEGFGKEVEVIVKRINDTAEKWAKDSKQKLDDFESFLNDSRNETQAKIDAMNNLIEDFKAKLIEHAFEKNGDYITAPLMNGDHIDLYTKVAAQKFKDDLNENFNTAKQDLQRRFDESIAKVYTKEQSDKRFTIPHNVLYPHSLIIGSSNAESGGWPKGTWDRWVTSKGEICHNYGYTGGGFTSTDDNNFNTQLARAISDSTGDRARLTGQIYIIDMLNDVRGNKDIYPSAKKFVQTAVNAFPNAKIYAIPVLFNENDLNNNWDMARNVFAMTNTLKSVLDPYKGLVCEGSRSWFHNGKNDTYFPPAAGVHFDTPGYEFAQRQFDMWLEGGSGWVDYGWHNLVSGANLAKVKNDSNLQAYVARKGDVVYVHGMCSTIAMRAFETIFQLPAWARPYRSMYITAWNSTTAWPVIVDNSGALVTSSSLGDNSTISFNGSYCIF